DRLQRLKLAGNPLVCNCTIRWLWRLVTGTLDDDDGDDPDGVAFLGKSLADHSNITTVLLIDKDEIACDLNEDGLVTRRTLRNMSESDINCPAHLVTVLSILLSLLLLTLGAGAAILYRRKTRERKKILQERKNVHERIVPQKVDKLELERYLAQQVLSNDYRELRPACDLPVRYDLKYPDQTAHQLGVPADVDPDSDHYENIDYLQHQRALGNSATANTPSPQSIITNPFHHHQPPSQYHYVQGHPQMQSQLHSATYQPHPSPQHHHHQHHQQHRHAQAPAMTMQHPHKYPHQQHHTAGPPPGAANSNSNTLPVPPVQRSLNNYSPNFFIYVLYSHFILLLLAL
uniref:LRRCT domain-containing protein n=1 Tax=Anopheles maculatus TaxID=74869 RepID=A0A182SV88_9DIPT